MPEFEQTLSEVLSCCADIDAAWRSKGYALEEFSNLVLGITDGKDFSRLGNMEEVASNLRGGVLSGVQELSSFSDLYIKLFDNGRFWVEILNWWESHINIHDHDFSGIQFQIRGRSLNVEYSFGSFGECGNVNFGRFQVKGADVWVPGSRSIVRPGRISPHNVCHLDSPTVSLLIRTHPEPGLGPQWNYFPPVAAASYGLAADVILRKQIQALRLLSRGSSQDFMRAAATHIEACTYNQLLFTLIKMIDIIFSGTHSELLIKLLNTGDEITKSCVECASYYYCSEFCKSLRGAQGITENDRITLAILSTIYDEESYIKVNSYLKSNYGIVRSLTPLADLYRNLAQREAELLSNVINTLGLEVHLQREISMNHVASMASQVAIAT